jgi:uncharacterized repeat protein (TIGR03803 family)
MKSIQRRAVTIVAATCVMTMLGATAAHARTYKVLYSFQDGSDGRHPSAVIRDVKGNLYGVTSYGYGAHSFGTIFKLSPAGRETVLHSFAATDGIPAYVPSGLIQDPERNLFGATAKGGGTGCSGGGCGVVFKLSPRGRYTVLHRFRGTDGSFPQGVIRDSKGNLYGATELGGSGTGCGGSGCGLVFKLSSAGKYTVLHRFTGGTGGYFPNGGMILEPNGNLYGTTLFGGDPSCVCGVVFKLGPTGKETVLHKFTYDDGAYPNGGIIRDAKGNLYGTTPTDASCGEYGVCGLVFKLSPLGVETVLYRFQGGADGGLPAAGVIQDRKGNIYGTTAYAGRPGCDGATGCGVVFKVDSNQKETVIYSFTGGVDGGVPQSGLLQDGKGNLYGTTTAGGAACGGLGCGVVFRLTP